jgi:ankyrin repeat protein/catechol 2,3-dioxygenase-like lactoylglutathione lyase family enzyme
MSSSQLPEHASLEYLKKLAKERLHALRRTDPRAKLATALLAIAREYGFSSWRALKAEVEARQANDVVRFLTACASGDADVVRELLAKKPELVRASNPAAPHGAWTGLHSAAKGGHPEIVRLLLDRGANPNAREEGDNTYPLHWAAAAGHVDVVRMLLDAGGDVHGVGDVHALDTIGWATFYHAPGDDPMAMNPSRRPLVDLLVTRGARHHIFSAMSVGDLELIQKLVEENPDALDRRMSRFEHGLTPLHFAMQRKRYDVLDLLLELGADVEAPDAAGRTPLAVAMLHGDREAMRRLHAAGAKPPETVATSSLTATMAKLAGATKKGVPMIYVPDVAKALEWYTSIGFKEIARYGDDGVVNFGMVSFGEAELMINMHGKKGRHDASLWFYTDQVDEVYRLLKARQLEAARASLAGGPSDDDGIQFEQDIEDMFYGARQFCIRDLNGYELYFIKSIDAD